MRSSTFDKIIDYTLEKEDYGFRKRIQIERDPDDAGGTTVLGLDKASHGKTVDRLIELIESGRNNEAIEIAKDVYDVCYYSKHKDKNGLPLFDKILDIKTISKIFDLCVNTGNGQAAKFVRRALNHLGAKLPVNSSFDDDVIFNKGINVPGTTNRRIIFATKSFQNYDYPYFGDSQGGAGWAFGGSQTYMISGTTYYNATKVIAALNGIGAAKIPTAINSDGTVKTWANVTL